ncbi:MAG: hypothetical protein QW046_00400 [Candidatus Micrarchaeaceae archaeon]
MRSKHSVDEKFEIVIEALTKNSTQQRYQETWNISHLTSKVKKAVHREL